MKVAPFKLVDRDLDILRYLGRFGVATTEDIRKKFWAATDTLNHHRRLRALVTRGLIEEMRGEIEGRKVYRLSRRGVALLEAKGMGPVHFTPKRPACRWNLDHETILARIYDLLEPCPAVRELRPDPEVRRELADHFGHREKPDSGFKAPDAFFELKTFRGNWKPAALELEIARKSKTRWKVLLKRMAEKPSAHFLLFVFPGTGHIKKFIRILDALAEEDPEVGTWRKRHSFQFTTIEELMEKGLDALWVGDGGSFRLSEITEATNKTTNKSSNSAYSPESELSAPGSSH